MRFIFFHSKYAWEFSNLVFREVYLMRVWAMGNTFSPDRCILYSSRFRKTCVFQWALFPIFSLFFHTKTFLRLLVLKPRKCLHFSVDYHMMNVNIPWMYFENLSWWRHFLTSSDFCFKPLKWGKIQWRQKMTSSTQIFKIHSGNVHNHHMIIHWKNEDICVVWTQVIPKTFLFLFVSLKNACFAETATV